MCVYVIGDIHGRFVALCEVIEKMSFDYDRDTLIVLGDVVDGGYDTQKVIEELLKIKNCILVIGNHDLWALNWMKTGIELPVWVHQGGLATMRAYGFSYKSVPDSHIKFLESGKPYYIDSKGRVYVHGGFNPTKKVEYNDLETLVWDRQLINYILDGNVVDYPHIFIGHTTTQFITKDTKPLTIGNLTLMDTGAGWNGKLTAMNVDTGEYFQSKLQIANSY
jgi:serine/threonine protein phosphatase 1